VLSRPFAPTFNLSANMGGRADYSPSPLYSRLIDVSKNKPESSGRAWPEMAVLAGMDFSSRVAI
jgi:hypothetical protein